MSKLFKYVVAICGLISTSVYAYECCNPCEVNGFDGFYVGGNIGILSHEASQNGLDLLAHSTATDTGFAGGVQVGYDWQCQNRVFGLVGDWNATSLGLHQRGTAASFRHDLEWYSTIRARAGLAVCNTLVYVTGGAAVAKLKHEWSTGTTSFGAHDTRWGWTGGVGAEFDLGCSWSAGAEVLYMNFAHNSKTSNGVRFDHSDSAFTGKLMVNYRFGDLFSCCR